MFAYKREKYFSYPSQLFNMYKCNKCYWYALIQGTDQNIGKINDQEHPLQQEYLHEYSNSYYMHHNNFFQIFIFDKYTTTDMHFFIYS